MKRTSLLRGCLGRRGHRRDQRQAGRRDIPALRPLGHGEHVRVDGRRGHNPGAGDRRDPRHPLAGPAGLHRAARWRAGLRGYALRRSLRGVSRSVCRCRPSGSARRSFLSACWTATTSTPRLFRPPMPNPWVCASIPGLAHWAMLGQLHYALWLSNGNGPDRMDNDKGKVVTARVSPKFLLGDAEMTFGLSGLYGSLPYWSLDSSRQFPQGPPILRYEIPARS